MKLTALNTLRSQLVPYVVCMGQYGGSQVCPNFLEWGITTLAYEFCREVSRQLFLRLRVCLNPYELVTGRQGGNEL